MNATAAREPLNLRLAIIARQRQTLHSSGKMGIATLQPMSKQFQPLKNKKSIQSRLPREDKFIFICYLYELCGLLFFVNPQSFYFFMDKFYFTLIDINPLSQEKRINYECTCR
jgi:hypothetical protein